MGDWHFLTKHARALLWIAHDPETRLRDLAEEIGTTERTAFAIVADLIEAGYLVKEKDGRRNRYHVQPHLPFPGTPGRERTVSDLLHLLVDDDPTAAASSHR